MARQLKRATTFHSRPLWIEFDDSTSLAVHPVPSASLSTIAVGASHLEILETVERGLLVEVSLTKWASGCRGCVLGGTQSCLRTRVGASPRRSYHHRNSAANSLPRGLVLGPAPAMNLWNGKSC